MMPNCPHCGGPSGVYRNCRAHGWIRDYYDPESGGLLETHMDGLRSSDSRTLRCADCEEVRRDVILTTGNQLAKVVTTKQYLKTMKGSIG